MEKQQITRTGLIALTAPFRWIIASSLIFFLAYGSINYPRAWIYIGCYFTGTLISTYIFIRKIPTLANERGKLKPGTKKWDTYILATYFSLAIIITPLVSGLDIRFNMTPLPIVYLYSGIALFVFSLVLSIWSMLHNPFFEGTVRVQTDRNQYAIDTGPYRFVRHPGYVAMIVAALPAPFAFGSSLGIIPGIIMIIVVVVRTYLEDNTLNEELEGYAEYCKKVRYRLIPFIW
jgi:protein-S-isoprenylcysteine O-methyltransferase Ste14